jgi:photosystem II stability/assembly factor-like uncharacterized protein
MNGLFFFNSRIGWAFGQDGYPGNGRIVASTDGGLTWTEQYPGTFSYFNSGFFVDSLTGWVVGNAVILKTTDGGATWLDQDTVFTRGPSSVPLHSAYFVNHDTGWVVGGISWVSVIAKTTDGGETWSHQIFEPPNPELDIGRLNWVQFVDDTTGWVVGRTFPGAEELIIKTTDGGTTWVRQDDRIARQLWSAHFTDHLHGWAVGEQGTILATTNGGTTFVRTTVNIPIELSLRQNYPNPFNPYTTFEFTLPTEGHIRLLVFDSLGKLITKIADGMRDPGAYAILFTADGLATGVYYARLQFHNVGGPTLTEVVKLLVVK